MLINDLHTRRREPDAVRRRLLDAAAALALAQGLGAVTVQAVAAAAGVTKGGLFHHFPSKEALLEAVFRDQLDQLDRSIDQALTAEPAGYGRFTRAYINTVLEHGTSPTAPLYAVLMLSHALRPLWRDWITARLTAHQDTDAATALELARFAADGIWLSDVWGLSGQILSDRAALRAKLLQDSHLPSQDGKAPRP